MLIPIDGVGQMIKKERKRLNLYFVTYCKFYLSQLHTPELQKLLTFWEDILNVISCFSFIVRTLACLHELL
jgi:hypothetical protein